MENVSLSHAFHNKERTLLLHCCCAPCSCSIIEQVLAAGVSPVLFFYNPNIHPEVEYQQRKDEIVRYAKKTAVPFIDADYDPERWLDHVRGHECDPERGVRCSLCFEFRLRKAAEYTSAHGISLFSTTLGISRWKNFDQVTEAGRRAASLHPGVVYLEYNWRKKSGSVRKDQLIAQEGLYRQSYCGCIYSLRSSKTCDM